MSIFRQTVVRIEVTTNEIEAMARAKAAEKYRKAMGFEPPAGTLITSDIYTLVPITFTYKTTVDNSPEKP